MPMTGLELSPSEWLRLLGHVRRWLSNLGRAGRERRLESRDALRAVILAVRETERYVSDLEDGRRHSRKRENRISQLWTRLSFELEDLKIAGLAKACRINGRYWSTRKEDGSSAYDKDFLRTAGARLADVERAANHALKALG